ncbi:hypothetical protein [Rhodoferax koreensis]|nr:hypothetical protein [Rhodoferax koreense]
MLVKYLDPAPTQANVEQAFNGFKTRNIEFPVGLTAGIRDIHKEGCIPVEEAAGYLCTLSYTMQYLASSTPLRVTKVHRLFPAEGGQWGQQVWNREVERDVAAAKERSEGHQFARLLGYTAASMLMAFMLHGTLPRLAWNALSMHEQATPWLATPIACGNAHVDGLSGGIAVGANALTPAAVVALFALALGALGFVLGGLVVPETFINLRYVGWSERLCLLTAAVSWCVAGMRMPALFIQLIALGVVLAILYVVLVLPTLWVITGESPGRVYAKHAVAVAKFVAPGPLRTGQPRQGYEGYRQLMNW